MNNYYAEFETDKYIREKFFLDYSYKGIMVEVGAGPPEVLSMSKHFRENGWRCICIEPNPNFVKRHKDIGNEIYQYACGDIEDMQNFEIAWSDKTNSLYNGISFSALKVNEDYITKYHTTREDINIETITVEVKKLNTILEYLKIDHIDFLSVDTGGWELEVMKGFNVKKYHPKIILLENVLQDEKYQKYMASIEYTLNNVIEYNYIFRNMGFKIEGISAAQHPDIAEPFLKIINDFDRIIEIGTWAGGLTLFLYKNKPTQCELISYDIDISLNEVPRKYNIDFRIGNCFSEETHNEIKQLIEDKSKRVLLLCDGGNKMKEVETFCKYLKSTDVIMCHDYIENWDEWIQYAKPIIWEGLIESFYDKLLPTIEKYNLKKYKYYDNFKAIFWGSFIKPT